LRSFRNFASTICVQNPVCFAILHLRDPAETWAQNRCLKNGALRDATFTQFTEALNVSWTAKPNPQRSCWLVCDAG